MMEVVITKCEAQHLSLQPCLDYVVIRDTHELEKSTLSSSRLMLTVISRACCGPLGVQVPWPHLSTDGESRPLKLPGRAFSDHHHPLLQANPTQVLVPTLEGQNLRARNF
jgi:hypothetical protein